MSRLAASVIMTVRGEPRERFAAALAAVAAQVGLPGPLEVVVALPPAESDILAGVRPTGAVAVLRTVANPTGARSTGLNRAARAAATATVVRVDARSRLAPDYVAGCLARLRADAKVGVVGGRQQPSLPDAGRPHRARGVARALANPWVLGGAAYRRPGASGPVDTVYLGAFRRRQLLALGGYDERLDANEDFELCQRYRAAGLTVWLEAGLAVDYEPRESLGALGRQYVAFGRSKVRFWRLTAGRPNTRQRVALAAPMVLLAVVAGVVATAPRPLAYAALLAAGGMLGALAVDTRAEPRRASPVVRAWSVAASGVILAGWLAGVALESARRRSTVPAKAGTGAGVHGDERSRPVRAA